MLSHHLACLQNHIQNRYIFNHCFIEMNIFIKRNHYSILLIIKNNKRLIYCLVIFFCSNLNAQPPLNYKATLTVQYTPGHPANTFIPSKTLGAAIDGHPQGDVDRILTTENINAMLAVGLKPVTYRLRTELEVETWHWNPEGTWSEADKQQGYWTSNDFSSTPILLSHGYRLPRRGNTHDQANDDSYSRLDDGDKKTFWKSNPYLDTYYTKDLNTEHSQWVIIDFGKLKEVNAIRINWADPYAISYKVDYALDIGKNYFDPFQPYLWHEFSNGNVAHQKGENKIVVISSKPVKVRFIRITMTESSYTSAKDSKDIRDKLGFAIYEIQAGLLNKKGKLHDWIKHARNYRQTVMHVSSTDPWHRATDVDNNTEQTGIDRFFSCGITNDQPVMMPVGLLYDIPENMAALIHYLIVKKYPVNEIEMGEEPEGQLVNPQDYAALYCQWANVIKKISPSVHLGGPCFAALDTHKEDDDVFTEKKWTKIFLDHLKAHNKLNDFNFFSFEWYPFDNTCGPSAPQLAIAPQMLYYALRKFKDSILPPNTPLYATEYGYSSHSGRAETDIEGALMYADILGKFLTLGGDKAFLYGYEPATLDQYDDCSWGNNMLFGMDKKGRIAYHTAAWFGMIMLTHQWAQPADSLLEIYPASSDAMNEIKQPLITAYPVKKPAGKWAIVLINKDPEHTWYVDVKIFNTATGKRSMLNFPLQLFQYSKLQYHWVDNKEKGHPTLALPPVEKKLIVASSIELPPYSLTIIRE